MAADASLAAAGGTPLPPHRMEGRRQADLHRPLPRADDGKTQPRPPAASSNRSCDIPSARIPQRLANRYATLRSLCRGHRPYPTFRGAPMAERSAWPVPHNSGACRAWISGRALHRRPRICPRIPCGSNGICPRELGMQKPSPFRPGSGADDPAAAQPRDWLSVDHQVISCWILVVSWMLSSIPDPRSGQGSTSVRRVFDRRMMTMLLLYPTAWAMSPPARSSAPCYEGSGLSGVDGQPAAGPHTGS